MARIERGQFSDFLRRYLGMAGETHVASELAPEVSPVMALESDRPEWEFLKGAKILSLADEQAGGAVGSSIRVRNPANSGVVAVIDQVIVSVSVAATVLITTSTEADLATVTTITQFREGRYLAALTGVATAMITSRANAAPGASGVRIRVFHSPGATPHVVPTTVVLTPGTTFTVGVATVGVDLAVSIDWLEKRLDILEQR